MALYNYQDISGYIYSSDEIRMKDGIRVRVGGNLLKHMPRAIEYANSDDRKRAAILTEERIRMIKKEGGTIRSPVTLGPLSPLKGFTTTTTSGPPGPHWVLDEVVPAYEEYEQDKKADQKIPTPLANRLKELK